MSLSILFTRNHLQVSPPVPYFRKPAKGFTLLEVMIAMAIFAIAFCGLSMLLMDMTFQDIDSERERTVANRAREVKEEIRAIAEMHKGMDATQRLGIAAVMQRYSDKPENRNRIRFDVRLPNTLPGDLNQIAEGHVYCYTDESAIPKYMSQLGASDDIEWSEAWLSDDRQTVAMDLNGNGRSDDDLTLDPSSIRMLLLEVAIYYKDSRGGNRFYRLPVIITN